MSIAAWKGPDEHDLLPTVTLHTGEYHASYLLPLLPSTKELARSSQPPTEEGDPIRSLCDAKN